MNPLLAHINEYSPLSEAACEAIGHCFEKVFLAKGKLLITKGQVCDHLYFVEQGALRGFYEADEKEITHWFAFENNFVTSFYSFTTGMRTVETIQLLEGSVLWKISKENMTRLCGQFHEVEHLVRIAYEDYYIRLEERFVNAQFRSSKELYENLLVQSPRVVERVPLRFIASYLGMTQETLSRIRSRL